MKSRNLFFLDVISNKISPTFVAYNNHFMIKKSFILSAFFTVFFFSFFLQKSYFSFSDTFLDQVEQTILNEDADFDKEESHLLQSSPGVQSPFIKISNGFENTIEPVVKRLIKKNLSGKSLKDKLLKKAITSYHFIIANPQLYSLSGCIILRQLLI